MLRSNPRKWSKRERSVAAITGLPVMVIGLILFRYVFPIHDFLVGVVFGLLFGFVILGVEILAVSLAPRFQPRHP